MAESISLNVSVKTKNGPAFGIAQNLEVDSYHKYSLTAEASSTKEYPLLGDVNINEVNFIALSCNHYGDKLKFTFKDGASSGSEILFDRPQLYIGVGSVGALIPSAAPIPKIGSIEFESTHTEDIQVDLLIAREVPAVP